MRINGGGRGGIHTVRTVSIYNEKIVEREANRYLKTHKYMTDVISIICGNKQCTVWQFSGSNLSKST
jgi:hypothetical protein